MSGASKISTSGELPPSPGPAYALGVSRYDQVSSVLLALLLLVGTGVGALVIIVYTMHVFATPKAIPVTLEQVATTADPSLGIARDLKPLGVEDVPALTEPQLQETLATVTEVVSESTAALADQSLDGDPQSTRGSGLGDNRQAGSGSEGLAERVPRAERWEIRFSETNLEAYARQLDFFGIELAVLGDDNRVKYAFKLSQPQPETRTQSPELEDRLYMTWQNGPLQAADRELLKRAGVAAESGIVLQFYPRAVESDLAQKERQFAGDRSIDTIRKTIFGIKQEGAAFSFYVIDQEYFDR